MQITLDKFTEIKEIKHTFSESLTAIKEELDQHLDSINQNSVEIQSNYDYIEEINKKVEKLESRIDDLCLLFEKGVNRGTPKPLSTHQFSLTNHEKEIFLALYTSQEPLSYEEIALRTSLPPYLVEELISSLKLKKIPLIERNFANKSFLMIDENFKEEQSKLNIVNMYR